MAECCTSYTLTADRGSVLWHTNTTLIPTPSRKNHAFICIQSSQVAAGVCIHRKTKSSPTVPSCVLYIFLSMIRFHRRTLFLQISLFRKNWLRYNFIRVWYTISSLFWGVQSWNKELWKKTGKNREIKNKIDKKIAREKQKECIPVLLDSNSGPQCYRIFVLLGKRNCEIQRVAKQGLHFQPEEAESLQRHQHQKEREPATFIFDSTLL